MIRLYIIEDHLTIILNGLKRLFHPSRDGITVIGSSSSVEEAILKADPGSFDVFILDLWLENKLPIQNIRNLTQHFPGKQIIVYTHEESSVWKRRMYVEGATAYVIKSAKRPELKMVIQKAARGEKYFNINLAEANQKKEIHSDEASSFYLPPIQKEIIILLSKGLRHKEIAESIKTSTSTVDKILKDLRDQFQVKNNLELLSLLKNDEELFI